ncbi:MAG: VWA domain-containing protein [Candidatus Promineifilaceae bacterium]
MTSETGHFLENILLFPRLLRQAGLPVSPEQSQDFARSLTLVDIGNREQVYHAARSMLVTRYEHLALFTAIFNRFWRVVMGDTTSQPQKMPRAPRHKPRSDAVPLMVLMSQKAGKNDPEEDVADKAGSYSAAELIQNKQFGAMTPEELETTRRLIREMRWEMIHRRTRRRVADKNGSSLYLRRVLRSAAKYGGVPLRLAWQDRKVKQRPFVLLADISGSMEKYSRLTLQFFYSVSHSFRDVECFVFGTRLTRITPQLKIKNIDIAIEEAAHQVWDWAGGTRIGDSLYDFNRRWSRRVLRRGAVVLIISDGWDRGETSRLKQEMRYLQHRCYRLIWLNPLLGQATYEPQVEGMTAALPYIDDFLPIHNLQSLTELSRHLAALD